MRETRAIFSIFIRTPGHVHNACRHISMNLGGHEYKRNSMLTRDVSIVVS